MGPPLFKRITFLGRTVTLGNPSPPEGNSTQKKRMTPQLPRGCPQHQKSRGQKLSPLKCGALKKALQYSMPV